MKLKTTLKISLMVVIEIIFCFTPLGTIPIGPIAATLCMVPVVIASLVFGKEIGMLLGFVFATCSFIFFTFLVPAAPTAFLFTPFSQAGGYKGNFFSLLICFIPRIIAGLTPVLVTELMSKKANNNYLANSVASFLGSMTNTVLFILLAFLFFGNELSRFAAESNMANAATLSNAAKVATLSNAAKVALEGNRVIADKGLTLILGLTFLTNGIPEAIVCAIVCPPVVKVLRKI